MKKIKKIFPLLLGIMVLMFGSLTVSAADDVNYNISGSGFEKMSAMVADIEKTYPYVIVFNDGYWVGSTSQFLYSPGSTWNHYHFSENSHTCYGFWRLNGKTFAYNTQMYELKTESYLDDIQNKEITYSNKDILWEKDTSKVFFPETVVPVAQKAEVLPAVVQNQTKVILTTAVVCLALLVILSVLPKKLPRFLNR